MPGIGVGFIPEVLSRVILDEVIEVTDEDAFTHSWLPPGQRQKTK